MGFFRGLGPKGPFSVVPHPPKIEYGYGPAFQPFNEVFTSNNLQVITIFIKSTVQVCFLDEQIYFIF